MHKEIIEFLSENRLTSQFILNSLIDPKELTLALAESRLFVDLHDGEIRFIAFVSKTGRLHLQGAFDAKVMTASRLFDFPTKRYFGINGPSSLMRPLETWLNTIQYPAPILIFRDTVLTLSLSDTSRAERQPQRARRLAQKDFTSWQRLYVAYLKEMGISASATTEERKVRFDEEVAKKMHWGLEVEGSLVAIVAFNSLGVNTAQVGGVYTDPVHRRKGCSEHAMRVLIHDAIHLHNLKELVLYTGANDVAPYQLYLKLGFKEQCEYWALEFNHLK